MSPDEQINVGDAAMRAAHRKSALSAEERRKAAEKRRKATEERRKAAEERRKEEERDWERMFRKTGRREYQEDLEHWTEERELLRLRRGLDLTRLAKLLGMVSSAHEGEIMNAVKLVEDERKRLGLSWEVILVVKIHRRQTNHQQPRPPAHA
jgi:hypothetical protein